MTSITELIEKLNERELRYRLFDLILVLDGMAITEVERSRLEHYIREVVEYLVNAQKKEYIIITNNLSDKTETLSIKCESKSDLCGWIRVLEIEKGRKIYKVLDGKKNEIDYEKVCEEGGEK